MKLVNETPFGAEIARTGVAEDKMAASVFARVTYALRDDGALFIADEQPFAPALEPQPTEYGLWPAEVPFKRAGVDVMVFGHAYAVGGSRATVVEVKVAIGEWSASVYAIGDRVWQKSLGAIAPSSPEPFDKMPLSLERAYGGTTVYDEAQLVFSDNPIGKGYYVEEEQALGKPLPNLEYPDKLVKAWSDLGTTAGVGFCPMVNSERLLASGMYDDEGNPVGFKGNLFNAAFQRMIAPAVRDGDVVSVEGVSPNGPIRFYAPATLLEARVSYDDFEIVRPMQIDQMLIDVEQKRIVVTYRYDFVYALVARQVRSCEVALVRSP